MIKIRRYSRGINPSK